ncbi:glycosyltransferase family 1 protein [Erythrobacteraceae bacterium CFH 75059]|uniref:glycosyltransferase family 4 protein n=1 Tax=Qipengyuania thermophila TaxID=2509361 RepID=UPI00102208C1|nr:glycosyltransferase family 4 protein [Qipengyuania thermophila]TCD04320.1 glycosyltransferase family 1 protein [Erythrobacteraceae bacterium CFH 75059]
MGDNQRRPGVLQGESRSIALITSGAGSLANFRGPLIRRFVERGCRVYALAPDHDATTRAQVRALGAEPIDISLERTGLRPARDMVDMLRLVATLRRLRPDMTFAYFIKPVIYGTLAATLAGVPRRFAMVAGLGYVFTSDGSADTLKRRALRMAATRLYSIAFRLCHRVFLQNEDDAAVLCGGGVLPRAKLAMVRGSGVDLAHFPPADPVTAPVTFILVARLLREKGIVEYAEAARRIKATNPDTVFLLAGGLDTNPGALSREVVASWVAEGVIEWPGQVADIRPWLARSSVFVLPSYREGKPRSTQEAMAMARPVITTDAPGCRDTVEEGVNGYMVPVRDPRALEAAMRRFLENPDLIARMGRESRALAEERFDVHRINDGMLKVMGFG